MIDSRSFLEGFRDGVSIATVLMVFIMSKFLTGRWFL